MRAGGNPDTVALKTNDRRRMKLHRPDLYKCKAKPIDTV
jgi:hypothetical protein